MTRESKLEREIRACEICRADLPEPPRPVFQLASGAPIQITSQAPGIRAHRKRLPFSDPSGDRLRDWLGVSESEFYDRRRIAILPMGFCYPGTGKGGDLPPRPECAAQWHSRVLRELGTPKLVLYIGAYALRHYLPAHFPGTLTQVVSQWRELGPRVIPLPHPSPRNLRWLRDNPWFELELLPVLRARVAKALTEAGSGEL